jgi:hypothetical protein
LTGLLDADRHIRVVLGHQRRTLQSASFSAGVAWLAPIAELNRLWHAAQSGFGTSSANAT